MGLVKAEAYLGHPVLIDNDTFGKPTVLLIVELKAFDCHLSKTLHHLRMIRDEYSSG